MRLSEVLAAEPDLLAQAKAIQTDPQAGFPILTAKLKLTWRCNLRCRMCALWRQGLEVGRDHLSGETVGKLLRALLAQGLRKVHFSGGEILLREDLPTILAEARELGLQVNLTTNGTLLTKEVARLLVAERVRSVAVSIDAASPALHDQMRGVAGAWEMAWAGIRRLQERSERKGRGPRLAVNTLISRLTVGQLESMHRLLCQRRIDRWTLLPLDTADDKLLPTQAQWEALAQTWQDFQPLLIRPPIDWTSARSAARAAKGKFAGVYYGQARCFAPWFNLFVNADGRAFPCCMGRTEMGSYGTVLNQPLEALLAGRRRREICCSLAAGHRFPICDCCDDFLEENRGIAALLEQTTWE